MDADGLEVVLHDAAFDALPAIANVGVKITVTNRGERARHELVTFHLPNHESRPVEKLAALSPRQLITALGEPVTVLLTKPGGPTIAVVGDGVLTRPGRYLLMCFTLSSLAPPGGLPAVDGAGRTEVTGGPSVVTAMYTQLLVTDSGRPTDVDIPRPGGSL